MTRNTANNSEMQRLVKDAVEQAVRTSLEEPIRELKGVVETLKKQPEAEKAINMKQGEEIQSLKLAINDLQQGKRLKYLRVFGVGVTEDEIKERGAEEATCKKVYDKVLLPILRGAVSKGLISEVPTIRQTLSCGYRSGKEMVDAQGRTIPPPLVVKFMSKEIRDAVLRSKKEFIPNPSTAEKAGGVRRFSLVEDLTRPTHQLFRELVADERVDGRLRFTKSGEENSRVYKALSPFSTVEELLKKK